MFLAAFGSFKYPMWQFFKYVQGKTIFFTEGITMCLLILRKNKITLYDKHN